MACKAILELPYSKRAFVERRAIGIGPGGAFFTTLHRRIIIKNGRGVQRGLKDHPLTTSHLFRRLPAPRSCDRLENC